MIVKSQIGINIFFRISRWMIFDSSRTFKNKFHMHNQYMFVATNKMIVIKKPKVLFFDLYGDFNNSVTLNPI